MKRLIFPIALTLLCPTILFAQLSPGAKKLTNYTWKVRESHIKIKSSDNYELVTPEEAESCLHKAIYEFKDDGTLVLKMDKALCGTNEMKGKWKLTYNDKNLLLKMDEATDTVSFLALYLGDAELVLEQSYKTEGYGGTTWEKIYLEPNNSNSIFAAELHSISRLNTGNHTAALKTMGYTSNGHNASQKYYSFKKGANGELKLYYDSKGRFNRMVYTSAIKLTGNSIWEFTNSSLFYVVLQ